MRRQRLGLALAWFAAVGCGRIGFDVGSDAATRCVASGRRAIAITTGSGGAPVGYSLAVTFDHAALAARGDSSPSGDDIRIDHFEGSSWVEIDRVLDPASTWNSAATTVWFRLQAALPVDTTIEGQYQLRFGVPGSPPRDPASVFHFADLFDRPDAADIAGGWRVLDASTGDVGNLDLAGDSLFFADVSQNDNRPIADHAFAPLTTVAWRIGFAWQRTGAEATYRVHMQLGDSTAMESAPSTASFSNLGAGPSLVWASPDQGVAADESLAADTGSMVVDLGPVSGRADLEVRADVATDTYELLVDGASRIADAPFASPRIRLDQIRFMTWDIGHDNFALRQFDYAIARPWLSPEPAVALGPVSCDVP